MLTLLRALRALAKSATKIDHYQTNQEKSSMRFSEICGSFHVVNVLKVYAILDK